MPYKNRAGEMFSLKYWHKQRQMKQLKQAQYACLFNEAPPGEYVCLDCETSTLDPKNAELLYLAAVRIVGKRIALSERLELMVRPEGHIDPRTIPIHGLRQQDVSTGIPLAEAMRSFLDFIGARPLIGYYLEFDLAVINRHIRPWLGIALPNRTIEVSGLYYDKKVSAYRPEVDLALDAILEQLDLPRWPRHNALYDAITAAAIWLKIAYSKTPW